MSPSFPREAIRLSAEKMTANEVCPFGAVVGRVGRVLGRGWNRVTSTNNPTAYAEVEAIRDAGANPGTFCLAGREIYCNCEPCPRCLAVSHWARPDRVQRGDVRRCGGRVRRPELLHGTGQAGRGACGPEGTGVAERGVHAPAGVGVEAG